MFCSICLSETTNTLRTECCKQDQHKTCLEKWCIKQWSATGTSTCPLCRGNIQIEIFCWVSAIIGSSGKLYGIAQAKLIRRGDIQSIIILHGREISYNNLYVHSTEQEARKHAKQCVTAKQDRALMFDPNYKYKPYPIRLLDREEILGWLDA